MRNSPSRHLFNFYILIFLAYMLFPLVIMGGGAFNDSQFPSVYPWKGFTDRWFIELWNDQRMWDSALNTLLVALAVVALAVPIGTAAAMVMNSLQGKSRSLLYGLMVAPILTPGAVIGISTLLFWNELNAPAGLHLSVLGQVAYISAYVMLLVFARLQSLDRGLEEAALDLGASHWQVIRRIVAPHLYPAIGASALIAFFQSLENYNVNLFTRGDSLASTVYVGSKLRTGFTPTINAMALILIVITIFGALAYELLRRREERRRDYLHMLAQKAEEATLAQGLGAR